MIGNVAAVQDTAHGKSRDSQSARGDIRNRALRIESRQVRVFESGYLGRDACNHEESLFTCIVSYSYRKISMRS